jgi:hypothetical protein
MFRATQSDAWSLMAKTDLSREPKNIDEAE